MTERITAVKRVELANVSEGYDSDCYAYVRPATYEDQKKLANKSFKGMSKEEQMDYQLSLVLDHFLSGKIKVFSDGEFVTAEMTPDDTAASVAITDALYAGIMDFDLDPKALRKAATEAVLQTTSEKPTETTSSEAKPNK
jgi:hypothetical protein